MEIATKTIQTHGTNSPSRIAAERNVEVLYEDLGRNIWGYYTYVHRIPVIHVNNRLEGFQRVFALGHELGHDIMHRGINTPFLKRNTLFSVDRIERQANSFSLYLHIGNEVPEIGETKCHFLKRCGIPEVFHIFY